MYVAESGMALGGAPPGGRILRFGANGDHEVLAQGLRPPVNGLVYHFGDLFITEGGHPAQISRLSADGQRIVILENLPGPGNYHTNTVAFGPDGKLYFSQGAMTNTGVVGTDAYGLAWLRRLPHAHDIPGYDITLRGINFETCDNTWTGAFVPFGHSTTPGQRIARALPSTASVLCCDPDGANLQLVAWGIRNAYGLGFLPDGRLIAIDQGADDRGSRPVGNAPDLLLEIRRGAWYGWPDYIGDIPITDPRFMPERGAAP